LASLSDAHVTSLLPVLTALVSQRVEFVPLVGRSVLPRAIAIAGALLREEPVSADAQTTIAAVMKLVLVLHTLSSAATKAQFLERIVLPFGADCLYNAPAPREALCVQVLHHLATTERDAFLGALASMKTRDEGGAVRAANAVRSAELAAEAERQAEADRRAAEQARLAQVEAMKKKQRDELQAAKKKTLALDSFE